MAAVKCCGTESLNPIPSKGLPAKRPFDLTNVAADSFLHSPMSLILNQLHVGSIAA
ncbi:conserved hypothetical protein [Ricinus communis]|uniref:Uncharacterized protein n=1 Tax=Ricinus communis TaxID=3988 RepID=B9S5N5_RICCO|nr:conserved hypothetical protein [Ricinus communis]